MNRTGLATSLVGLLVSAAVVAGEDGVMDAMPPATQPKPRVRVTISKETTWITQPLRPDGYPDYLEAYNGEASRGVTPENNAAVPYLKAVGPREIPKEARADFFRRRGMKELPESGDYFVPLVESVLGRATLPDEPETTDPDRDRELCRLWDELDAARDRPWVATEHPEVARWLKAVDAPLARVVEASRRSRFYVPARDWTSGLDLMATRDCVRALKVRAMLAAGHGRFESAVADLLAVMRFARLLALSPGAIDRMLYTSFSDGAARNLSTLLHYAKPNSNQLRWLEKELRGLPAVPPLRRTFDVGDRLSNLDGICEGARQGPVSWYYVDDRFGARAWPAAVVWTLDGLLIRCTDWDIVLRNQNKMTDEIVATLDCLPRLKPLDEMHKLRSRLKERYDVPHSLSEWRVLLESRPFRECPHARSHRPCWLIQVVLPAAWWSLTCAPVRS